MGTWKIETKGVSPEGEYYESTEYSKNKAYGKLIDAVHDRKKKKKAKKKSSKWDKPVQSKRIIKKSTGGTLKIVVKDEPYKSHIFKR